MQKPYTFVCYDDDPDWLNHRFKHVTASESSVLLDRSPWKSRDQLFSEKAAMSSPFKDSNSMWWGRESERFNMQMFTKITGIRTRSCNAFLRSNICPVLACTIDGFALAPKGRKEVLDVAVKKGWLPEFMDEVHKREGLGLIEMKNTEVWSRKKWFPQPPDYYYIQVQHQLFVTGLDWALLVAKVGAGDMVGHVIDADKALHKMLKEDATAFWKEVEDARRELDSF